MSPVIATLFGAVGTVAAVLAVLLPVIRSQGSALRRELDTLRGDLRADVASLRADIGEVRREQRADMAAMRADLHALAERVARIEGAFSGPWRPPTNGGPSNPAEPPVVPNPASPESAT